MRAAGRGSTMEEFRLFVNHRGNNYAEGVSPAMKNCGGDTALVNNCIPEKFTSGVTPWL